MVVTRKISLQTKGDCDIIDITAQVVDFDNRPRSRQIVLQIMGE